MYKYCILQIIFMFSRENKWEGVGERERGQRVLRIQDLNFLVIIYENVTQ